MATVTCIRNTVGNEKGTHLIDFELFQGRGRKPSCGILYIEKTAEDNDRIEGIVVGGCSHGLDLHSLGNKVHIKNTTPPGGHFLISAEN